MVTPQMVMCVITSVTSSTCHQVALDQQAVGQPVNQAQPQFDEDSIIVQFLSVHKRTNAGL